MQKLILLFFILLQAFSVKAQHLEPALPGEDIKEATGKISGNSIALFNSQADLTSTTTYDQTTAEAENGLLYTGRLEEVYLLNSSAPVTDSLVSDPAVMYARGKADARLYYKGRGTLWGSAAASVIIPYGYVVPVTLALIKPKLNVAEVPDMKLLQNEDYVRGYLKQAHNRKIGKAAAGAGIGTGVGAIIVTIAILSILASLN